MAVSVFELFSVGIGPSSSHTVGPMRAARAFAIALRDEGFLTATHRVGIDLLGSLGATGRGHHSDRAVILGLMGQTPEDVDPALAEQLIERVRLTNRLDLLGEWPIAFDEHSDLALTGGVVLPRHPNGMVFRAYDSDGELLREGTYYSVGGGFVLDDADHEIVPPEHVEPLPLPFTTGAELLARCTESAEGVSGVMLANELVLRSQADIESGLLRIWRVMQECVRAGCDTRGTLPGGLSVRRRAPELRAQLDAGSSDPLHVLDWVSLYALAVNEENAAGGRVVTAPTNGAAGIIPAVLHYYRDWVPGATDDGVVKFLLAAGAIGLIVKENASISGAEVGCQGEVGSACAMAAAGLTEVMGGTPEQVENAAEIAIEHNLGLTCDPVGGLVQIPCIERNAIAAVKAITAARTALNGDGRHVVSLDQVIRTMRQTGADMMTIYKETSLGGLAVNVIEC
jgi:L-serine dehydratase